MFGKKRKVSSRWLNGLTHAEVMFNRYYNAIEGMYDPIEHRVRVMLTIVRMREHLQRINDDGLMEHHMMCGYTDFILNKVQREGLTNELSSYIPSWVSDDWDVTPRSVHSRSTGE